MADIDEYVMDPEARSAAERLLQRFDHLESQLATLIAAAELVIERWDENALASSRLEAVEFLREAVDLARPATKEIHGR